MKLEAVTKVIDGRKYQYYDSRKGDVALVMLHGIGINKDYMYPMYQRFSEEFRCIALDLPGHNGLDLCGVRNFDDYADYVHGLIREIVPGKYCLLGFSLGGLVISRYVEKYKDDEVFGCAVVCGSPIVGFRRGITFKGRVGITFVRHVPSFLYSFVQEKSRFRKLTRVLGLPLSEVELDGLSEYERKYAIPTLDLIRREKFNCVSGVRQLYIYGTGDDFVSVANYEYVKSLDLENCETVLVESGKHIGTVDGWNKAVDRISEFLLQDI